MPTTRPAGSITPAQASALRRKLYRRAIPIVFAWFLLVGVVAGVLSHRLWLTLPLSLLAAIVISVWVRAVGLRNIRQMESGQR
jgi:hypothetical protein